VLSVVPVLPAVGAELPAAEVVALPVPWEAPAAPVATPAILVAVAVNVLVGWGLFDGWSQVNCMLGILNVEKYQKHLSWRNPFVCCAQMLSWYLSCLGSALHI
jgi:hypothetical protein